MRRNHLLPFLFIVLVALAAGIGTVAYGNEPQLGLDLQGGVSVVYEATTPAESDTLDQVTEIIRSRVDALGVAEPEISRQGDSILVQLPGVRDPQRALDIIGQTAELRFRPVLQLLPPGGTNASTTSTPAGDGTTTTTTSAGGTTTSTTAATTTTSTTAATTTTADDEQGLGAPGSPWGPRFARGGGSTTTTAPATTTSAPTGTTLPTGTTTSTTAAGAPGTTTTTIDPAAVPDLGAELTPPEEDVEDAEVVLAEYDPETGEEVLRYRLGPTAVTGSILRSAKAELQQNAEWVVAVEIKGDRLADFNAIAAACYAGQPTCPAVNGERGQLAIVLDHRVQSAPAIQEPSFTGEGISISGSFDERGAKDLALVLRYGSLPIELEPQETRTVSATLGKDALDAGVASGIVGLILVAGYMILYYRLLGLVAVTSLGVSAVLLWAVISHFGTNGGLALTLAGVTGIVVSIGIAVDSNVVFYEHLREDVSRGRTLRSVVEGSFHDAFSTIVKADLASLIGAGVLYFLTVGPVRGFAFYLGLSTVLDLISSYFFMRPLTLMLVRSRRLQHRERLFGMPRTRAIEGGVAT